MVDISYIGDEVCRQGITMYNYITQTILSAVQSNLAYMYHYTDYTVYSTVKPGLYVSLHRLYCLPNNQTCLIGIRALSEANLQGRATYSDYYIGIVIFNCTEPVMRGHLCYEVTFSSQNECPDQIGLTV